jgi:hypothetical protein
VPAGGQPEEAGVGVGDAVGAAHEVAQPVAVRLAAQSRVLLRGAAREELQRALRGVKHSYLIVIPAIIIGILKGRMGFQQHTHSSIPVLL